MRQQLSELRRAMQAHGIDLYIIPTPLFFVSNPDSPFYQSQAFGKVIDYMMKYTRRCDLREQNGKRSMLIKDVSNVETAVSVLQEIVALQPNGL